MPNLYKVDTVGCPSFEDFCKDPTSETLPSLPSGAEKMNLETISCEQTGKTVPADQDVCRCPPTLTFASGVPPTTFPPTYFTLLPFFWQAL